MTNKKNSEIYGFVGWREFLSVREEILREVDRAKDKNVSRAVRTSHGVAAEAIIRKWLTEFLPGRYGVTSGFIIPSEVEQDYSLQHFDVIIYDRLNSHIMWIDSDEDTSDQGKHRAIPAQFVSGVIECKASFTTAAAVDAIKKISSLGAYSQSFTEKIFTAIVFADIHGNEVMNYRALKNTILDEMPIGYIGGAILRCPTNPKISGRFYPIGPLTDVLEDHCEKCNVPLYKNVDDYPCFRELYEDSEGLVVQPGFANDFMLWPDSESGEMACNILKIHRTIAGSEGRWIQMDWSYDMFGKFATDLLGALNGKWMSDDARSPFGRVFHRIPENDGSLGPENAAFIKLPLPLHSYAKQDFERN